MPLLLAAPLSRWRVTFHKSVFVCVCVCVCVFEPPPLHYMIPLPFHSMMTHTHTHTRSLFVTLLCFEAVVTALCSMM